MIDAPGLRCVALACTVKNTAVKLVRTISPKQAQGRITDWCRARYPGVGEHDTEFAELRDRCGNRAFDFFNFCNVRLYRQHAFPEFSAGPRPGSSGSAQWLRARLPQGKAVPWLSRCRYCRR